MHYHYGPRWTSITWTRSWSNHQTAMQKPAVQYLCKALWATGSKHQSGSTRAVSSHRPCQTSYLSTQWQMPLISLHHNTVSIWTHIFTDGSAKNAVRNGGSGAYIHCSDGTTSSLSIPAGDLSSSYGDLSSNYRAEFMPWKLPQNTRLRKTATSRILSCSLTPCMLFSLSQMAPLTFAPSSYTTACVLCQIPTE